MQASKTYCYENNDHINRANLALMCSEYLGIKDVSPSLYLIAAPVSELACVNKDGGIIWSRGEIEEAIPWNERSMRTFGVVYCYEATASFIGLDGRTYVVPNDKPVLDHLEECGYIIAPYGKNLDGSQNGDDSLIAKIEDNNSIFDYREIDKNLPIEIVNKIDEIENNRPYIRHNAPYDGLLTFGGTLALYSATEEELEQLTLSERKIANIKTYGRVYESQDIEDYVKFALQQRYLKGQNDPSNKKS